MHLSLRMCTYYLYPLFYQTSKTETSNETLEQRDIYDKNLTLHSIYSYFLLIVLENHKEPITRETKAVEPGNIFILYTVL